MKGKEILALLDEPACEHNQKQNPAAAPLSPALPPAVAPSTARR